MDNVAGLICTKCGQYKATSEFSPDKSKKRGFVYTCRNCRALLRSVEREMLSNAKSRAARKGLDFNITTNDIAELRENQNNLCVYSGTPLNWDIIDAGKQRVCPPDRVSLDRIDSSLGYINGNVQLITDFCNRIKTWYPEKDVLEFCRRVVEYNK